MENVNLPVRRILRGKRGRPDRFRLREFFERFFRLFGFFRLSGFFLPGFPGFFRGLLRARSLPGLFFRALRFFGNALLRQLRRGFSRQLRHGLRRIGRHFSDGLIFRRLIAGHIPGLVSRNRLFRGRRIRRNEALISRIRDALRRPAVSILRHLRNLLPGFRSREGFRYALLRRAYRHDRRKQQKHTQKHCQKPLIHSLSLLAIYYIFVTIIL